MLPFIISALVVVMLVGPVMMLRPSSTQRKQARLRSLAAQNGLIVSTGEADPKGQYFVTYILPSKKGKDSRDTWSLKRQRFSHEGHFFNEWDWLHAPEKRGLRDETGLKHLLEKEAEDFLTLSVERLGIGVSWNEKLRGKTAELAVAEVKAFLQAVEKLLGESRS